MKFCVVILSILSFHSAAYFQSNEMPKTPVLLELFTAEGCAVCPKAERVLSELVSQQPVAGVEIIPIALHVDYWDKYGIRDIYASPLFTNRQLVYEEKFKKGRVFTPQMIVDGEYLFIGTRKEIAQTMIDKAKAAPKSNISLRQIGDKIEVEVRDLPPHEVSSLFLAITEDGLNHRIARLNQTEDSVPQVAVTRNLKAISRIDGATNEAHQSVQLDLDKKWVANNLNAVIFLQENGSRKIIGVAKIKLNNQNVAGEKQ